MGGGERGLTADREVGIGQVFFVIRERGSTLVFVETVVVHVTKVKLVLVRLCHTMRNQTTLRHET